MQRWIGLVLFVLGAGPWVWVVYGIVRAYTSMVDASLDVASTEPAEDALRASANLGVRLLPFTLPAAVVGVVLMRRRRRIVRREP